MACGTAPPPVRITATIASASVSARSAAAITRSASARDLTVEQRPEQRLRAREAAVDGGPGAAGLAGDVVERRLGRRRPGRCRRAPRRGSRSGCAFGRWCPPLRQYSADRLIVSTCQRVTFAAHVSRAGQTTSRERDHEQHGDRHDQDRHRAPEQEPAPGRERRVVAAVVEHRRRDRRAHDPPQERFLAVGVVGRSPVALRSPGPFGAVTRRSRRAARRGRARGPAPGRRSPSGRAR